MFERLQAIFPSLLPMRMSAENVESLHSTGLKRPEHIWEKFRLLSMVESIRFFMRL